MHALFRRGMLYVAGCLWMTQSLMGITQDQKKTKMIEDLEVIKHHFDIAYAPLEWKKEHLGWDLEEAYQKAKTQILDARSLTTKQFQGILRRFFNSLKDYHVSVQFYSTESATLPFMIRGAEGRYFIDWIDPLKLPPSHYGIAIGDELLEFDGQPIARAIESRLKEAGREVNPTATDLRLAEIDLTRRTGAKGDVVPKGSVMIKVASQAQEKAFNHQLHWMYQPEKIRNPFDLFSFLEIAGLDEKELKKDLLISSCLPNKHVDFRRFLVGEDEKETTRGGLGAFIPFLPLFAQPIWISQKFLDSTRQEGLEEIKWYAYIYRHEGHLFGYVRIPHYQVGFIELQQLGEILAFLDQNTDALVVDQLHNTGGMSDVLQTIASMFATDALQAPRNRMKLTQKEVMEAYQTLELIKSNKDDFLQYFDGDYQALLCVQDYLEEMIEEWNEGRTLTKPLYLGGVDCIKPHVMYRYTKPLVMLIDEADFSCGDVMPAIIQDNQRGALFGKKTAGAGGFISMLEFPNIHGIRACHYTSSIMERPNHHKKIENLGIEPDVPYELTVEDLTQGYRGYIDNVNKVLTELLEEEISTKAE